MHSTEPMTNYQMQLHLKRGPEAMMPTRICLAVRKALRLPALVWVRFPQPDGTYIYEQRPV